MPSALLGIRHGVAMLAQAQTCETTAVVGVADRGIEPDRRLEVVQRQPGRVRDDVQPAPPAQERRSVRSQGHRIGHVLDGAREVFPLGPGQAAQLVNRGRRLAPGDERVARSDDVVVTFQLEQQVDPQAVGIVVVADDLERGIPGRQGVGVAMIEGQQPAPIGVVLRQHRVVRFLESDRLVQIAQGLHPLGRSRVLARENARRLDRGTEARRVRSASMARLNCSTASSGLPCFR